MTLLFLSSIRRFWLKKSEVSDIIKIYILSTLHLDIKKGAAYMKYGGGNDKLFIAPLTSGLLAILSVLQPMLDLKLPIAEPYRWPITIALLLITVLLSIIIFYSRHRKHQKDTLPGFSILPADSNISRYLLKHPSKKYNQGFYIHAGKFVLSLKESNERSILNRPLVDQSIHWVFEGRNTNQDPIESFTMGITLSAFTSWKDGSIQINAKLRNRDTPYVNVENILEKPYKDFPDFRCIRFVFPQSIMYAQSFTLEVSMVWTRGCHFQDLERYFADPRNYGMRIDKLAIEVQSDINDIMDRMISLYSVQNQNMDGSFLLVPPPNSKKICLPGKIQWNVQPSINSVYVIEIKNA